MSQLDRRRIANPFKGVRFSYCVPSYAALVQWKNVCPISGMLSVRFRHAVPVFSVWDKSSLQVLETWSRGAVPRTLTKVNSGYDEMVSYDLRSVEVQVRFLVPWPVLSPRSVTVASLARNQEAAVQLCPRWPKFYSAERKYGQARDC